MSKSKNISTSCTCNNRLAKAGVEQIRKMYEAGRGTSKHENQRAERMSAKKEDRFADYAHAYKDKIYSSSTAKRYEQAWRAYASWQSAERGNSKKLSKANSPYEIAKYGEWMQAKGMSASTIKTNVSAVCKVAGIGIKDFRDGKYGWIPPKRSSGDYRNNRNSDTNSGRYNANNYADSIRIGQATGLRKSELKRLRGDYLAYNEGKPYVIIKGKGGKVSSREICGSPEDVQYVIELLKTAGSKKVCPHVPSHFGQHRNRAQYAANIYKSYARPQQVLNSVAKTDPHNKAIIITRIDRPGVPAGTVLDRRAAEKAAHELGHGSQRAATFIASYAYKLYNN